MINFPDSPIPGQVHTVGAASWTFDGTKWVATSGSGGGITQLTGDVTAGPGAGSQAATLASTAVTAGAYTSANITVDAKGRLTAAANGSGAVAAHPGYVAGLYYTRQIQGLPTNASFGITSLMATPLQIHSAITIDQVTWTVSALGTGGVGRFGIYSSSGARPVTLIRDFGTVSVAATGVVTLAVSPGLALSPGWYWQAAGFSVACSGVANASTDATTGALLGWTGLSNAGPPLFGFNMSGNAAVAGLPTTFVVSTNMLSTGPLVGFRVT